MEFNPTDIKGLYSISLNKLEDERGLFARTYCKQAFKKIGFDKEFVQFNHSCNKYKGTIRGMHFQQMPYSETKLIRCIQGAVYDVSVDLRKGSPTFMQHYGINLSAENMISILIPEGFAHGFQTLSENAILIYHHTEYYTPTADSGIRYNDPALGINWPLTPAAVSEKDKTYTLIDAQFKSIKI